MLRSRVSSGIDFARLSQALMRPGIDPRVWVSYAVLTSEPVVDRSGDDAGVFVDLILLPTQMEATARVGAIYAGNGFGLYAPLHIDDEVVVIAPSGDPNEGLVVTQRVWSPSDLPPQSAADNPNDLTLVVESGKSLRISAQGEGSVYLTTETGKVYLGDATAEKAVARVDDLVAVDATPVVPPEINMATWMTTVTAFVNGLSPGLLPGTPTNVGTIATGASKVVAS